MTERRVLFVDDEDHILAGLRDLFRKHRRVWRMAFVSGGEAALNELGGAPFDVIVSDMRMPGMDGAALLERVKNNHPTVARIVLSGHAEAEAIERVMPVANQFLPKPCDGETLRVTIERTAGLYKLIHDPRVADVVRHFTSSPAVCRAAARLAEATGFDAIAARGDELLNELGRVPAVAGSASGDASGDSRWQQVRTDAFVAARIARRLLTNPAQAQHAFTAAIVHDVGELVLAAAIPDRFKAAFDKARAASAPLHVGEQQLLGATHATVGAHLLDVWGLPFPIVEAVANHHAPSLVTEGRCDVLAVVHAATNLASADGECGLDLAFLARAGVAAELPRWRTVAEAERGAA
jgi:DNA-binding NarL/FixJ family response regulator